MPRKVATTKQTGNGGSLFEAKVAAHFLTMMLGGEPPLGRNCGFHRRVSFQARTSGWVLDDLLLEMHGKLGESSCPFSVKSNLQINSEGFPAEFVQDAWTVWHNLESKNFASDRDYIGFAVGPLTAQVETTLNRLLADAGSSDPVSLARRYTTANSSNKLARKLFRSCSFIQDGRESADEDIASFIARLKVSSFDFERNDSRSERDSISACWKLLKDGSSRSQGESLWNELISIARELATTGGYTDIVTLLRILHSRYELRCHPDFASDFDLLVNNSRLVMSTVPDKIGGSVAIDRDSQTSELLQAMQQVDVVALLGMSGSGKTVLAKLAAQRLNGLALWFDAQTFDVPTIRDVEKSLGPPSPSLKNSQTFYGIECSLGSGWH